jgi:hypothetical protein
MTEILAYGSNNTFTGVVDQSGTTLTIVSISSGTVAVGSLIDISGNLPVSVLRNISGTGVGSTWLVNLSQTVNDEDGIAEKYQVQNLLNSFFNSITKPTYSLLYSAVAGGEYYISNSIDGSSPGSQLRTLISIGDGTVVIDTSKSATINTYVNFARKITIASTSVNSSNAFTVTGVSPASTGTLTIGTAGGNQVNENHNTRPEILVACLSSGGIGFATRFSSSISAYLLYLALRVGISSENPLGFIRLSVPEQI